MLSFEHKITNGRISVIMPCYNAENFLEDSINSVLKQTYNDVELIIVDDGSTDGSRNILEDYATRHPDRVFVIYQANKGPYPARNFALQKAKGEFIAFLDADDYWNTNCLEKLHAQLIDLNCDISYCGWQNIFENGENGKPYIPPEYESEDIFVGFLKGWPWPIHAAMSRRTIISEAGRFSTRCFSSMDYDLWIPLSAITKKISRVPEVLAFYRWHNHGQISSVKWQQVLDSRKVRQDFISRNPNLTSHIPERTLTEFIDGYLSRQAYDAFWKRDITSAQQLFRAMWRFGKWHSKDLKYIILSFLPTSFLKGIVRIFD